MPTYVVAQDRTKTGRTNISGADVMVITAASAAIAKELAAAQQNGDGNSWSDATATEIVTTSTLEGWTVNVRVGLVASVSVVGDPAETWDTIAARLVTALNATTPISNASYNSTTNVLTVAGAADNLGDEQLHVEFIPPGKVESVPSMVGTIVDGGVEAAALTVALPADAAIPLVTGAYRQV